MAPAERPPQGHEVTRRRTWRAGVAGLALALVTSVNGQSSQQPSHPRPGWPCVGRPDPSFVQVAEGSGGQVFLFDPSELGDSAVLLIAGDKHGETVFRGSGALADGVHEFSIPIDSTIESALFSISLQCLQTIEITAPDGTPLSASAQGVDWHAFQAGRIVTIASPIPGPWRVRVAGRGLFFLVVKGRSDLSLHDVYFVREGGRPGHEGLFRATEPPRIGVPQLFEASMSGPIGTPQFALISSSAELLQRVALQAQEAGQEFLGHVTPPEAGFRLMVSGVDPKGFPYQRVQPQLLQGAGAR